MYKFAVFGDSRNRDKPLWAIMEDLRRRKDLEFAVHTGDVVVNESRVDKFEKYLDKAEKVPFPIYTCRGNHDIGILDQYPDIKRYEQWKKVGFHRPDRFIKLDNAQDKWGNEQREFIKKWMKDESRKFVFCHKPLDDVVFPDGRRVSHNQGEVPGANEDAKWLRGLAAKKDIECFLVGHYHGFGVQMLQENALMITDGRGGAPSYGNHYYPGYTLFYVYPNSWTFQKINVMNKTV